MKLKRFLFIICFVMCNTFLYAQVPMLDEAILNSAVRINRGLPAGSTVAIINFSTNSSALNRYVINELHGAILRQRRITTLLPDENQTQNITSNLNFGNAGEVISESAQLIGQFLGVQYLITGTIGRFGVEYRLIFDIVNTSNTDQRNQYFTPVDLQNDQRFNQRGFGDILNLLSATSATGSTSNATPKEELPMVTGVEISLSDASVIRGWTHNFSVSVSGNGNYDRSVTWSVIGSSNLDTSINGNGILTVAANETSTELKVQAASVFNPQVSGTVDVIIRNSTVTEVTIYPENASVGKGKKINFRAVVLGIEDPPQDVIWSITGASSEKTIINEYGVLSVAENETSTVFTVNASSMFDSQISTSTSIIILPPPVNFLSVEASILGGGLRYERFISDFIALGAHVFWNTFEKTVDASLLFSIIFFPGNSIFFTELGLGIGYREDYIVYEYQSGAARRSGELAYNAVGVMINPAVGIRLGRKTKGFFANAFLNVPIMLGERSWLGYEGGPDEFISAGLRCGIGLGIAW